MARAVFSAVALALLKEQTYGLQASSNKASKPSSPPQFNDDLVDTIILIPEYKLAFCYMEKVGCTTFNHLWSAVRALKDPDQAKGEPWFRNNYEAHNMTKAQLEQVFVDPTWHKAMFYREPVERYVSAWQSKCGGGDPGGLKVCKTVFEGNHEFDDTVHWLQDFDKVHWGRNDTLIWGPWRRQVDFCGGLKNSLQYYDTVEQLDRDSSRFKVKTLMEKVGIDVEQVPQFNELFPADESYKDDSHNTDAGDSVCSYVKGKPWAVDILNKHFEEDSALFNIPKFKLETQCGSKQLLRGSDAAAGWPLVDDNERKWGNPPPANARDSADVLELRATATPRRRRFHGCSGEDGAIC